MLKFKQLIISLTGELIAGGKNSKNHSENLNYLKF